MTVYVDNAQMPFGKRMKMSHMLADELHELHVMADKIGLNRKYFQDSGTVPHYDVSKNKRLLAIKNGAVEVDMRKVHDIAKTWRARINK